jgi:GST-like protein
MLRFYFSGAPNPTKVALFIEEAGLPYEAIPVDTRKGEQHKPEYLAINPNAKVPAIVDGDVTVFDSNAILLYLGEKTGKFMPPAGDKMRGELLSWLMFVASGVGPYSGQSVHFRMYAPEKNEYAINRYAFEAQRHFGILDARLAKQKYMVGETYTIVDMAVWGWARSMPVVLGEAAWEKFPNLKRLVDEISARAGGAESRGITGKAQIQDRNGRRGAPGNVPPSARKGRVKTRPASQILVTPRCNEPRASLARPGQGAASARTVGSGVRLVKWASGLSHCCRKHNGLGRF